MTTPNNERQQWLDFAHTVDVLTASALATSDLAETPGGGTKKSARRNWLSGLFASSYGGRAVGGALVAACLLLVAVPVSRMLNTAVPGIGDTAQRPGDELITQVDTARPLGDSGPQPIELQILLAKTSYRIGEPLSFALRTNKDCRLLIYSIGANNEVRLFDPTLSTVVTGEPVLKADDPLQIPALGTPGPAITPPSPGSYTIGALCSNETLSALGTSLAVLREKAEQGGSSFESYLAGLIGGDQFAVTRTAYEVK